MHVLVGGGTGFIGRNLVKNLKSKGFTVTIASRTSASTEKISWDEIKQFGLPASINAIVNLAGEPILQPHRDSSSFLEKCRNSRIETTKICAQLCSDRQAAGDPIGTYIQGTAVGYYHIGEHGKGQIWDETSKGGEIGEMAKLVRDWENAAKLEEHCTTRQIILRTGVVMGNGGGIIRNTIPSFKFGLGGPITMEGNQVRL